MSQLRQPSARATAIIFAGAAVLIALPAAAFADRDDRHERHDRDRRDHGSVVVVDRVYDTRYHHDHYYLPRGHEIDFVPREAVSVRFGGSPFFFHEGIWYRPHGPRFTVIAPPFGVVVPILPPFYTTVWARGVPYYYANDVYYTWQPEEHGYVVSRPPNEGDVSTQASPSNDDLFIYPKNGQNDKTQATDRFECHSWANKETSYDPSLPGGGVQAKEAVDKRAAYFRAMTACLEGRGYSVK